MSQNVAAFITKLITHFPVKHESQAREQEWMASMVRNMRGYSSTVLGKAAQKIIDTRTDRRFPLPAECKKACGDIAAEEASVNKGQLAVDHRPPTFSDARIGLADDLVKSALGRQAAKEGWILSLHDFARNHMRMPSEREIAACKAAAREFDEAYALCLRGHGGPCSSALIRLGDCMLKRRAELTARLA